MTRFCYQYNVKQGSPMPCRQEDFEQMLDSEEVAQICRQISALDKKDPHFEDKKGELKRRLPIIIPHAAAFSGKRRISAEATPSGLVMLDVDHVEDPRQKWEEVVARIPSLRGKGGQAEPDGERPLIYFVAITPSGHGLRLIAERQIGETMEAAQLRLAGACGFEEIDGVTKDLARASYMMPRSYVLHYDPKGMFSFPNSSIEEYWGNENDNHNDNDNENHNDNTPSALSGAQSSNASRSSSLGEKEEGRGKGAIYKGLHYSDIVERLMMLMGYGDGVLQGERNNVYFALAVNLRYVCDFNADLLFAVIPDFGLQSQERRAIIKSAMGRPRRTEIPTVVQSAVLICEQQQTVEERNELKGRASDLPLPKLPRLLSLVCRRLPEAYRPAMVIAALPVIGTLATGVRFRYLDGQIHSPSFFTCISAPCASGKSFIRRPVDLLLTPINEQDEIEREKERIYKEKLRASKNAKNQPEDPHACPRNNGVNISIAKLLELLIYAESKHLIGVCEEMDSLIKSERAGVWSEKSDIYRLGFDNAEYSQAYKNENSMLVKVPVYYNLLLTGTPRSMERFFKADAIENGLMTRTCFAQLPDTSYTQMPHFEAYTDKEAEEIIRWARVLCQQNGELVCPVVNKAIDDWQEEKRQRALEADSHAADIIRRRSAVIGFRAGMLCYLLENKTNKKSIADFAVWVAEYTFRSQMEMFGDKLESEISSGLEKTTEYGAAIGLIDQLPLEFETKDLIALKAKRGQSVKPSVVSMLLKRWKDAKKIEKIGTGKFRKL